MDLDLKDKTALVTGSSRGTGAVIAATLAREGAFVFVHQLDGGDGQSIVQSIDANEGRAELVTGDIRTNEGASRLSKLVKDTGRTIDILINNYGVADGGSWLKSETDDWVQDYERNVLSAVRTIRAFVEPMKKKNWGRIVQIGTIGSTRPNARMPGYYAAKAALAASTVSLAKELGRTGITVNTVSPGLIHTAEVEAHFMKLAEKKGWGSSWGEVEPHVVRDFMDNPTGRIARPEDIAHLVTYLASPLAAHINGQNIRVDGGAVDIV